MMDHPNIARVLDAGATDTGRPYFVMELVKGDSITHFCDANNFSTEERLGLFVQVCQAVQHAHQKGIIHRDIKPSNVMVTLHDGVPVPKVIDFGIAKAINRQLTEKTLFTRYAQIIGTPAYMSPEQAELSGLDIDIRTDVYSLGTLLYELLTGSPPFESEYLLSKSYEEMQRIIREQEPTRPSTKINTLGQARIDVAKYRNTNPETLEKLIRADLDWIVMKTLEKDRSRRYDSVSEFAADIRRYLNSEPVLAGPPSTIYRIRKFIKRHRVLVTASAAIAASIILGLIISTSLYLRMRQALDTVSQLENKVETDSRLSNAERLYAEGRYHAALNEINVILDAQNPDRKSQLLKAQLLVELGQSEEAEAQLLPLTKEEPGIAGAAYSLLARINVGVHDANAAEYEALAASMLPDTAEAYSLRAMTAPSPQEALQWLDRAITLDPSHYSSLKARALTYYRLGNDEKMIEDVGALIALRPADSLGYALRAILRRQSGRFEEAVADHTLAIELCENERELCDFYHQRFETYKAMGDHAAALADARHCAQLDPQSRSHRFNIFSSLLEMKDFAEAQAEYRSIVQTSYVWDFRFDQSVAEYVFEKLSRGRTVAIPPEMIQQAPFAHMHRIAQCYHAFAGKSRLIELERQGFMVWGCSPDGEELLVGWAELYRGMAGTIERVSSPVAPISAGLKIINIESGEERLIVSAYGNSAAWSPDGQYIAFAGPDSDVHLVPAEGGQPRKIAPGTWPQWSKDSRRLYFKTPEEEVCFINIDDPDPIPEKVVKCPGRFVINEGQNWIAYERSTGISIVDLSSGALLRQIRSPWPLNLWHLSLSPDGRELWFRAWWTPANIGSFILDTQEMQLYRVFDYPVDSLFRSQDGSKLIIGTRPTAWIMEVDPNVSICQPFGGKIADNDLITDQIETKSQAIAADPLYPENYLERGLAYMSLGQKQKAESDLQQFDRLVTKDDHHVIYRIFLWMKEYYTNELDETAEFLAPYAEHLMDRFPEDVASYRDLMVAIVDKTESDGRSEIADRWRAKLQKVERR
jgi:serine/threonine protein kinase/Tfp pilus assembly protein PilF